MQQNATEAGKKVAVLPAAQPQSWSVFTYFGGQKNRPKPTKSAPKTPPESPQTDGQFRQGFTCQRTVRLSHTTAALSSRAHGRAAPRAFSCKNAGKFF